MWASALVLLETSGKPLLPPFLATIEVVRSIDIVYVLWFCNYLQNHESNQTKWLFSKTGDQMKSYFVVLFRRGQTA